MPRKKEFDEFEVLQRAMEIFWHKGYEATSVQDLVDQMGINRGSLYGTFSDKRALFIAAIKYYDSTVVSSVVSVLHQPESPRDAIEQYIRNVAARAAEDTHRRGDFLTNAAVELHDSEAEGHLQASMQRIEAAFYDALVTARRLGEIGTAGDLHDLARFLTSGLQGIRVMARVNPNRQALLAIAEIMISVLDR